MKRAGRVDVTFVPKPWGYELVWAQTNKYVGKLLHIKAGHSLSLQFHRKKDETIHLLRGRMIYRVRRNGVLRKVAFRKGQSFHNTPGTVHQMEAITDCDLLEASTPHHRDVVRLKDRYGREGTNAP